MIYTTTYSKTITENNQEWSADDSVNDITTSGTITAVPDIKVTSALASESSPVTNTSYTTKQISWGIAAGGWVSQTFTLTSVATHLLSAISIKQHDYSPGFTAGTWTMEIWDASETTLLGTKDLYINSSSSSWRTFTFDSPIEVVPSTQYKLKMTSNGSAKMPIASANASNPYAGGVADASASRPSAADDLLFIAYTLNYSNIDTPIVYNTADIGIKCNMANIMLTGDIRRINSDGSGAVSFQDDFSTGKYLIDATYLNVTQDFNNNKLNIADDGYLYYQIDTKYPITGIPTLTTQIDITAGVPTIQISTDGSTWYDIDIAIVNDVDTEYELDNAISLSLNGKTTFYFRINCGGIGTVTCSVKSFELDIDINTTTAQNPYIFYDTINTFKCDQDVESGINCTIELISEESILQPITIF